MRRSLSLFAQHVRSGQANLIQIRNGTFYREHPSADRKESSSSNPPLFPGLEFDVPATPQKDVGSPIRKSQHWAVISATDGTTFLEILQGSHLCFPPTARTFPYLASEEIEQKDHRLRIPSRAIQYVGFGSGKGHDFGSGIRGAYLSARYESRREETDWSVLQYLKGETELNPGQDLGDKHVETPLLDRVIVDLRLQKLVSMPVSSLSNGQTRRARIAKALLGRPELLLLDEPFMGLDPPTLVTLSPMLRDLAYRSSPLLLLALRPQDPIPDWITHLVVLGQNHTVALMGEKAQVLFRLHRWADVAGSDRPFGRKSLPDYQMAEQMSRVYGPPPAGVGDALGAKGISRYTIYERFQAAPEWQYVNRDGTINLKELSLKDRARWEAAHQKKGSDRTLDDLLALTATLPADLADEGESADSHATIGVQKSSSTRPATQMEATSTTRPLGEPLIELHSVVVKYGTKTVLGHPPPQPGFTEPGLHLTVRQGTRLALLGPNGSGKTTLLSLLTSDHPHSYSLPIKFFGRSRLPSPGHPGLSLWEIQSRIGHSSPEIHAFFPKRMNVRQVLESAWAETYSGKPKLTYERDEMVDAFLRWWEPELRQTVHQVKEQETKKPNPYVPKANRSQMRVLMEQSYPPIISTESDSQSAAESTLSPTTELDWAEDTHYHAFAVLPFAAQRLLLLLRAMIKQPDIMILDEAFSGLSAETRDKAMCWLEHGETMFLQRRLIAAAASRDATDDAAGRLASEDRKPDRSAELGISQTAEKPPKRGRGRPKNGASGSTSTAHDFDGDTNDDTAWDEHAFSKGGRWEVVKVPNYRGDVLKILRKLDLDLDELVRRRNFKAEYVRVHEASREELLKLSDEFQNEHGNEDIGKYRFEGLNEKQALVVVSHVKEEVPHIVDEWVRLPGEEEVAESGRAVEMGRCDGGTIRTSEGWNRVWGLESKT